MATGMVSSASVQQNAQVLRVGEKLATTQQAIIDPTSRVYKHMIPGARFVMPDGLEIVFMGGQFATADKEIIAELDRVANKSTSMIYTEKTAAALAIANQKQAAADAADTAGKTPE